VLIPYFFVMAPHIPAHDLWWLAASGAGYGARYLRQWRRSVSLRKRFDDDDPTEMLLDLQDRYGYNAHSLVSIAPGAEAWTSPGIDGAIIYGKFGRVWLAAGDPLCDPADAGELARRFANAAGDRGRVAAFVPTTARFGIEAAKAGFSSVKVGAAPYFDLTCWAPKGDKAKKMRAGVNQARRAGVTVERWLNLDDELKTETADLCLRWLNSRRAATSFGWLLALDPFLHSDKKQLFGARNSEGQLVGLIAASPMPARECWYLEDVLRRPDAPQGTADLLVVEALQGLAASGAKLATLGTAPLATEGEDVIPPGEHKVVERALKLAAGRLEPFYNFEGLRRFKAKFVPTYWESEYVLSRKGVMVPPRVAHAIVRAIAPGGMTQLLTRKVARTLKPLVHGRSSPR
jgi:phosphatidylglycerol lysyltransferase